MKPHCPPAGFTLLTSHVQHASHAYVWCMVYTNLKANLVELSIQVAPDVQQRGLGVGLQQGALREVCVELLGQKFAAGMPAVCSNTGRDMARYRDYMVRLTSMQTIQTNYQLFN